MELEMQPLGPSPHPDNDRCGPKAASSNRNLKMIVGSALSGVIVGCLAILAVRRRLEGLHMAPGSNPSSPVCADWWSCVGSYWLRENEAVPVFMPSKVFANDSNRLHDITGTIIHRFALKEDTPIQANDAWANYISWEMEESIEDNPPERRPRSVNQFFDRADGIAKMHNAQTLDDVRKRREKFQRMVMFGSIDPLDLVMRLAFTSDRADKKNGVVTQFVHALQTFGAMQRNGVTDRELLFAAIIHDVGKIGDFVETDAFISGCTVDALNWEEVPDQGGLGSLVLPYDHHDFGADKLRPYVSSRVYRIIRYHCFPKLFREHPDVLRVMTPEERQQLPELQQFFGYDQLSKSVWITPNVDMGEIRQILREFLPTKIEF